MGHSVQAFIAKAAVLQEAAKWLKGVHVIPLAQGYSLLPLTDELCDGVLGEKPRLDKPYWEFWRLSPELAQFAAALSKSGPVAYIETESFSQSAILWERGSVVCGPLNGKVGPRDTMVWRIGLRFGPVNSVLRHMGVTKDGNRDEFEALGLHRYRSNSDWIEQPRRGT